MLKISKAGIEEYLDKWLDAIISNTSGCGTTLKDYGHIFKNDKDFKKKAKKISDLTKDITEYLHENLKLNYKNTEEKKLQSSLSFCLFNAARSKNS